MNITDPSCITGVAGLMNYEGSVDLETLEKNIINDIEETDEIGDVDLYKQQLETLGDSLGIDFTDDAGGDDIMQASPEPYSYPQYTPASPEAVSNMYSNTMNISRDPHMERITDEQKRQRILGHVLDGEENSDFSVEKEKEEDMKAILTEQVDMLLSGLADEGVDVSRIPPITEDSSLKEIEKIHKILRLKNDRNRYCSFAEECILAGSSALEWAFDGNKSYMGRTPNLEGWSATVNIKLRRMRYDTSTFVSEVMQDYNLGHGTRIALELLPSLFLYSKMKNNQKSDNLITSDEMNDAFDKIRDIDEQDG